MKISYLLALVCVASSASVCVAQSSDYPGASDIPTLARPANSFIIGAMHIDNDEYQVPVGSVAQSATKFGKTVTATGAIDVLAYSGPVTTSSLSTYMALAKQLQDGGYTEVWSCARATCGSAFTLISLLSQPLVDATSQTNIIDALDAANDDVRYGAFRKGDEYMLIAGTLSPGKASGAFVARVGGPAGQSVMQSGSPAAQNSTPSDNNSNSQNSGKAQKVRSVAHSLWNRIPQ